MAKYLFIRHGETDSNKIKKIMGHSEVQINSRGRLQAIQCGKYLANNYQNITAIYCSNLLRARETIELIAKEIKFSKEIIYKSELAERSFGELEGFPVTEVFKKLENENGEYDKTKRPLNGESDYEFNQRVREGIEGILNETKNTGDNETIIILTHGGSLRVIIEYFINHNSTIKANFPIKARNCSLTSISSNNNSWNEFTFDYVNFYQYLKE